ncbi:YMR147W [Zygosaccharomyces parabailii]|nr:YMR147W [Zygosaccharomyces parabailii]CDH13080.1 uncharacterized protein ZBAI_04866 [Zygosaccharomyces bailii ISA1307]
MSVTHFASAKSTMEKHSGSSCGSGNTHRKHGSSKFAKFSPNSTGLSNLKAPENYASFERLAPSPPFDTKLFPAAVSYEQNSAAKQPSLKDQIKNLEPTSESPINKLTQIADSISGPFTESEVQELLLTYTLTSGMIDGCSKQNSALITDYVERLRSKLKKQWMRIALGTVDTIDRFQSKLYEYFWLGAIYVNLCFPKLTTFIRYGI